jgi:hypothetical protein
MALRIAISFLILSHDCDWSGKILSCNRSTRKSGLAITSPLGVMFEREESELGVSLRFEAKHFGPAVPGHP